eukprot:CAMPEP_0183355670 /NCGR_PEP_ID=MMETSP0164_2-20130417/41338_1 /TAXON_ID=221442 /ORGANISM="Coccolithus pelagicus ssp braarudi, Strain PLY182g" /LENGTH=42 /DNA_ID= /DNA_START= /DNA_END= /DNA_ORIENTATION=
MPDSLHEVCVDVIPHAVVRVGDAREASIVRDTELHQLDYTCV